MRALSGYDVLVITAVHPAALLRLVRRGLSCRSFARLGQAYRGRCQPRRFRLHGVVQLILHFDAPRFNVGIDQQGNGSIGRYGCFSAAGELLPSLQRGLR